MSASKVYFLTGANRGIGLEFAKAISSQKDSLLIATARDPANATELNALAEKSGNVKVIKLDVSSAASISALANVLPELAPEGIDYFISNAGISNPASTRPSIQVEESVWTDHYNTNVLGPILLTQQLFPYLSKKATKTMHYVSTGVASISQFMGAGMSAYSQSKAALNFSIRTFATELGPQGFKVVAVSPGFVDTDMGKASLTVLEEGAPDMYNYLQSIKITPQESATKQLGLINGYTAEDNGKFYSFDGTEIPW